MNRQIPSFSRPLLLAALALAALSVPASAQAAEGGGAVDVYGASLQSTGPDSDSIHGYGLRGSYRFNRTWALEGALTRPDAGFTSWFGDVSAKAYFAHFNASSEHRVELYGLAGAGFYRIEFFGEHTSRSTAHAGLGAEIGLTDRLYLRPEVRGRWLTNNLRSDDGIAEYSLGLGWKL